MPGFSSRNRNDPEGAEHGFHQRDKRCLRRRDQSRTGGEEDEADRQLHRAEQEQVEEIAAGHLKGTAPRHGEADEHPSSAVPRQVAGVMRTWL